MTIPQHWREEIADKKWREAMVSEMDALKENNTWKLVSLPLRKQL